MDFLVAFTERAPDGSDQRRTEKLTYPAPTPAAYREAHRRWMSGSAAQHRYNLEVLPIVTTARPA